MRTKIIYECGCIGNISDNNIYMRYISCPEHKDMHEILDPPSKVIVREEH